MLFPPAALALISNNAVPGDATYPVKRFLEDGIFTVASINPVSKAWFAAARSDRRFKEFNTLVAQGKKSGETLNELVEQTQVAANQIAQVKDEAQKQKLVLKLSESIKKYDQGLAQLSTQPSAPPAPTSVPSPQPTQTSAPQPAPLQPAVPTQTQPSVVQGPIPRSTAPPQPSQAPIPTPPPAPPPTPGGGTSCDSISDHIQKARCELAKIKGGLEEQPTEGHGEKPKREDEEGQNKQSDHQPQSSSDQSSKSKGRHGK